MDGLTTPASSRITCAGAQMVAVTGRRPILSAANNGPTAWIDSSGRVVKRIPRGTNGSVIATPVADDRESIYLTISDWPARVMALVFVLFIVEALRKHRANRQPKPEAA